LKIAAKPLHMETWLLLTTYRKSPVLYLMVPSPRPLPFGQLFSWQSQYAISR